jgi:hypothetical protein
MVRKNNGGRSERLVADYERSGLTRREYCERHGIAVTTLDYHVRRRRMNRAAANLVPVTVTGASIAASGEALGERGFTLVLANGCRIETGWNFRDEAMTRLIRIAGAA